MCDKTVVIMLESGKTTAHCTLEPGHGGNHYDGVFFIGWKDSVE